MSVDRQYGKIVFSCDECGDDIETDETEFMDALAYIKAHDWLVKRNDDDTEWLHICPECTMGNNR